MDNSNMVSALDKLNKKQIKALHQLEDIQLMETLNVSEEKLKSLKKKLAKVEGVPERGIETWYRLASKNLYARRQIVDTKSNILITVNSIMISVILGSLYPRLAEDPHLIYGITPIIIGNLLSITYAIFATRPKIGKGIFTDNEIFGKKANLMTFDDYYKMPLATYELALSEVMKDRNFLYNTIIRDIHQLGVELSGRYQNIRIAYNIFLVGLTIGIIAFFSCHILVTF